MPQRLIDNISVSRKISNRTYRATVVFSLECDLTFISICSIKICSRKQDIVEKPLQYISNPMYIVCICRNNHSKRPINPIGSYAPRSTPPTKKINEFAAHQGEVCDVTFSPDGYTLATGGDDKLVHLWDVSNPAQKPELKLTLRGCNSGKWILIFFFDLKMG